jgi:ketol-acid reductoisomerase
MATPVLESLPGTRIFRDADATIDPLLGKTLAIIGYGNQGRSQALNLRDSGLTVIVGNAADAYAEQAVADGFPTMPIPEASQRADVVMCLVPDELTPAIYAESIRPGLTTRKTLCFASGYSVCFKQVAFPDQIDVVMVAPRTMGDLVRSTYLSGRGFLSFVDVHQDASGTAWQTTLAIAKAIGSLKFYAIHASFKDETESDLFTEQTLVPAIVAAVSTAVEVLVEAGYPKVEALLELYLSGEMGDIMHEAARLGLVGQTALHSPTSRFGTLSRLDKYKTPELRALMQRELANIRAGNFAREWADDQAAGYPTFNAVKQALQESEFGRVEREVMGELGLLGERDAAMYAPSRGGPV